MRASNLIAPCCDRCTHKPGSPCRDLIKCIAEGPVCHQDDACAKKRREHLADAKRGGQGTLIFVGAGTCGRANGSTKVIARIGEFLKQHQIVACAIAAAAWAGAFRFADDLLLDPANDARAWPTYLGWPTPISIPATSTSSSKPCSCAEKRAIASFTVVTAKPDPNGPTFPRWPPPSSSSVK